MPNNARGRRSGDGPGREGPRVCRRQWKTPVGPGSFWNLYGAGERWQGRKRCCSPEVEKQAWVLQQSRLGLVSALSSALNLCVCAGAGVPAALHTPHSLADSSGSWPWGRSEPQLGGGERAFLLWAGERALLTEAFITLAAGTSGVGRFCSRRRPCLGILLRPVQAGTLSPCAARTCQSLPRTQEPATEMVLSRAISPSPPCSNGSDVKADYTCLF